MTKPTKRDLFKKRLEIFPVEYPEFAGFVDAIHHSYWLFTEYNYDSDIQHFKTKLAPHEKEAITRCMLAISQIEVNVKRFWGDIYYIFPKPEIDEVGATFMDCHIDGTEVLTPKGWVDFKNIKEDDLVLQYNADGSSNFTPVLAVQNHEYEGKMCKFSKQNWECVVSPNHRMLYNQDGAEDIVEELAKDFKPSLGKNIPHVGFKRTGSSAVLTTEEKLFIYIWLNNDKEPVKVDDKTIYTIDIDSDFDETIITDIMKSLSASTRNNVEVKKRVMTVEFTKDYEIETFGWVNLETITKGWTYVFDSVINLYNLKDRPIMSNNKSAIDKLQAIYTLGGKYTTIKLNEEGQYVLNIENTDDLTNSTAVKEEMDYKGYIRCCTVPSGMLFTRYNDRVTISGNSEQRHLAAYRHLLERMGLIEIFQGVKDIPQLMARVNYMEQFTRNKNLSPEQSVLSLVLFSLFIEHISLFSQFLTINAFNKYRNEFKGINNAIEATSKEEELHGRFGIELFKIIAVEHKELLNDDFYRQLDEMSEIAFKAEMDIVDWIFEQGELNFLPKETIKNYIRKRYNNSLITLGLGPKYDVDEALYREVEWFDIEVLATKENDFFNKRSIDYTKFASSATADDLF